MLILPKSCFIHVPKTGGSWVKRAILASGIQAREFAIDGNTHVGFASSPVPNLFRFAFVRHPVSLYRSYWQFKITNGWDANNEIDQLCQADNFTTFVESVLERFPGVYTQSLLEFVGEPGEEIEFIGHYENLVEDLILALQQAGETFDEAALRSLPPFNVSDKKKAPAEYSSELEEKVRLAEAAVINRFYQGL